MMLPEHIVRQKLSDGRHMPASNNKVFQFSHQGKQYYAKIYKKKVCFERETFALENFGASDIPVPKIVFKSASFGEAGSCLIVTEQIKGRPLSSIQRHRHRYNQESGRLLSKIHRLEFAQIARPMDISFDEFEHKMKAFAQEENLEHPLLKLIKQTWEELKDSTRQDVMSHGDYCDRHIFALRGAISGILDWEQLRFVKQEYDLAHECALIDIFGRPGDERDFIRAYGLPFDEDLTCKLKFYYKLLFANHWKKAKLEKRYRKALCSIKAHFA